VEIEKIKGMNDIKAIQKNKDTGCWNEKVGKRKFKRVV
jgi:hypothetical protein